MTARDRLIHEMTHNHLYMTDERAAELVDDLLHEEAVKQRNWDAEAEGYTDPQMAVYAVADSMDPKAQP